MREIAVFIFVCGILSLGTWLGLRQKTVSHESVKANLVLEFSDGLDFGLKETAK